MAGSFGRPRISPGSLAEYLADTIAWLMRSMLGHDSKILFDKDIQLLLTPKFWVLPLYREFLNSARRIRPSPSSERARGCTGLVKGKILFFAHVVRARSSDGRESSI